MDSARLASVAAPDGGGGETALRSIWIVNHYAGAPGIGTGWRHWELGRRWSKAGVEVRLFTASTAIGGGKAAAREIDRSIEGLHFHFVDARAYEGNSLGRALNLAGFAWRVPSAMRRVLQAGALPPDAVIASSPQPFVWPGVAAFCRRERCAFIPEIRDVWPESLQEIGGMPSWHPLVLACAVARRRAMKCADLIFSPLSRIDQHAAAFGIAPERCVIVPNGVDTEVASRGRGLAVSVPGADAVPSRRRLLYAGAMGRPNALDGLVDAVGMIPAESRRCLTILMIGDGTERSRIESRTRRECSGVFEFLGPREQRDIESVAATCHGAVINWLPRTVYRFGLSPQKVPLYLALGLPVIAATPDEDDAIQRESLGWWSPAGETGALRDSIQGFLACDGATLAAMSARCTAHARRTLDWDAISARALDALQAFRARRHGA